MNIDDPVTIAQKSVRSGKNSLLRTLPHAITLIIKQELWRGRTDKDGNEFKSFREFCEYRIIWGLEIEYEKLRTYCSVDEECTRLLNEIEPALGEHGDGPGRGNKRGSNTTSFISDRGSNYNIRRLKRDHPELAQAVINGELSANAAAIQAGFRKPSLTISCDAHSAEAAIRRKFGDEFSVELGRLLLGQDAVYNDSITANASPRDS